MSESTDRLRSRALEARKEKRFEDARNLLLDAVEILRTENDRVELATALRDLGEVERRLDGAAARRHYEEAVALLREFDDPLALAHTIRHLGDVFYETGLAPQAEPCFREALEIYRKNPKTTTLDLANAIRSLAVLKGGGGENNEARQLWTEAHDLYVSVGVEAGVAESNARLARLKREE